MGSFRDNIPKGWTHTSLGEAYEIIGGGTPSTEVAEYWSGDIPWITSADIEGVRQINVRKYVTEKGIKGSTTSKVPPKTLLVVTRVGLGKIAISEVNICFSQDLQGLLQKPEFIWPEYTLHLLSYELQILKFEGRGTTISGVTKKQLKDLGFPLPPHNEQLRIVAKIEKLFSELDKGIENLKTAREQLKVYRQALLKHAFEGKLTAKWREETVGAGSKPALDSDVKGGRVTDRAPTKRRKDLPHLTAEELAELPELPLGWGWVKYGDLCSKVRNGISEKPVGESGTKIFRISAVRPMFFDMDDYRFIDNSSGRFDDNFLARGDLVFTRYNGSRHYVGVCARYNSDERRLFPDKLIQTRTDCSQVDTSYLEKALNCGEARRFIESKIRTTAGQSGVSGADIKNIPVPLCSVEEQAEILNIIEEKLSEVDHLDQTIATALQQSESLRLSILKKAFSGRLVPQDPHDEPASVLLERIRAEKRTTVKAGKSQKDKAGRPKKGASAGE